MIDLIDGKGLVGDPEIRATSADHLGNIGHSKANFAYGIADVLAHKSLFRWKLTDVLDYRAPHLGHTFAATCYSKSQTISRLEDGSRGLLHRLCRCWVLLLLLRRVF